MFINESTIFCFKGELRGIYKSILFGWISDCSYHFLDPFFSFMIVTKISCLKSAKKKSWSSAILVRYELCHYGQQSLMTSMRQVKLIWLDFVPVIWIRQFGISEKGFNLSSDVSFSQLSCKKKRSYLLNTTETGDKHQLFGPLGLHKNLAKLWWISVPSMASQRISSA